MLHNLHRIVVFYCEVYRYKTKNPLNQHFRTYVSLLNKCLEFQCFAFLENSTGAKVAGYLD